MGGRALVVGAGPAGLMAADRLSEGGWQVTIAEAMPSPARKLLMAGKSGLNITKDEAAEPFADAFGPGAERLCRILEAFGPPQMRAFAEGLGQPVFTGSSGRVFPVAMKASPLLRAWLARLDGRGVRLERRWRWTGWQADAPRFETPGGTRTAAADALVLALGGASWRRLGSDGAWAPILAERGVPLAPFQPANMGFSAAWSAHMAPHMGAPIKAVALMAAGQRVEAEFVLSERGLEGGGIYALSRALRQGAPLTLDLLPRLSHPQVAARLSRRPRRTTLTEHLRKALRLDPAKRALIREWGRPLPETSESLASFMKNLPVPIDGPRPIDEAISTAGGVAWDALDDGLMLRAVPNTWCAGEMIDWEAPTGGYLLTACLATGRHAAEAILRR